MCEQFEFARFEDRKARREYQCSECHRDISKGNKYECLTAKWAGQIDSIRTCIECRDFRQLCYDHGFYDTDCGGIVYGGDFRESMLECGGGLLGHLSDPNAQNPSRAEVPDYWFDAITRSQDAWNKRYAVKRLDSA